MKSFLSAAWSGEWIVERTTAKQRRAWNYRLMMAWLVFGSVVWFILRDALWFVGWMSLYAIWVTHANSWSAETPVEPE